MISQKVNRVGKRISFLIVICLSSINSHAQTPGLEVEGNGVVIPALTTAERDALSSPSPGWMIYNTTTDCFEFYRSGGWFNLCDELNRHEAVMPVNTLIGGSEKDELEAFTQAADGGFGLVGTSESSATGDVTDNSNGNSDYWVTKLNNAGNLVWERLVGGSEFETAAAIAATADGGFIVGGQSISSANGDVTEVSNGFNDCWVVKFGPEGSIEWDRLLGGDFNEQVQDIIQTLDGGYIFVANSTSPQSGDITDMPNGSNDVWVVKLDPAGNISWNVLLGGSGAEIPGAIIQNPDSTYVFAAQSSSSQSGDVTDMSNGGNDFWVVKLDTDGSIIWEYLYGGDAGENPQDIIRSTDGKYFIGGVSASSQTGDVGSLSQGLTDYWVIRLDSMGLLEWDELLGGASFEVLNGMAMDDEGGLLLVGSSNSNAPSGDIHSTNHGGQEGWIVKLDSLGHFEWEKQIGGSMLDGAQGATQGPGGSWIIASNSSSSQSGDVQGFSNGMWDFWVVKLDRYGNVE